MKCQIVPFDENIDSIVPLCNYLTTSNIILFKWLHACVIQVHILLTDTPV